MRLEITTHLTPARPVPHLSGDAVAVTEDGAIALVLHGMMGQGGGPLVASLAQRAWLESVASRGGEPMRVRLERGLQSIQDALAQGQQGWSGVQLAAIALDGEGIWLAHAGLPRIYRRREGAVRRMTDDHAVPGHPDVTTRALGPDGGMPALIREPVMAGDRFLLATGRLFQGVSEAELAGAFDRFADFAARAPCAAALATVL